MKTFNRYKEGTMKSFNRHAAFSLRAVLVATVVMFGIIRSNDYVSGAASAAFAGKHPAQVAARWRQTSGPEGAGITTLLSNGPNLFAGTSAGVVFRSTDQGESWTAINEGLPGVRIDSLAAVGANIFAGTAGVGVFRLNYHDERWVAVNSGLTNLGINALAVSGTYIVAGTRGSGVFRSLDKGESWTPVNTGLPPNASIISFAAVGTDIFAGLSSLAGAGVFRSDDQGKSWAALDTGFSNIGVSGFAAVGTDIFALLGDGRVIRSSSRGEKWTLVNTGLPLSTRVTSLAVIGADIYAGTANF